MQETRAKLNTLSTASPISQKIDASKNVKSLIADLASMSGKKGAVGISLNKMLSFGATIPGTEAYNYKATFNQLKDTLASANLDKLKGAMSDKDIEFLRNIGTKLSLGMTEEAFDAELKKLDNKMNDVLIANGVDPATVNTLSTYSNEQLLQLPVNSQSVSNSQFFK